MSGLQSDRYPHRRLGSQHDLPWHRLDSEALLRTLLATLVLLALAVSATAGTFRLTMTAPLGNNAGTCESPTIITASDSVYVHVLFNTTHDIMKRRRGGAVDRRYDVPQLDVPVTVYVTRLVDGAELKSCDTTVVVRTYVIPPTKPQVRLEQAP